MSKNDNLLFSLAFQRIYHFFSITGYIRVVSLYVKTSALSSWLYILHFTLNFGYDLPVEQIDNPVGIRSIVLRVRYHDNGGSFFIQFR